MSFEGIRGKKKSVAYHRPTRTALPTHQSQLQREPAEILTDPDRGTQEASNVVGRRR